MNRHLFGMAALATLTACGGGGATADNKAMVVTCAGYMSALEMAMDTQDAPGFTKAVVETGNADLKGREQLLELRASDFVEASRTYRVGMDPTKAAQLEQDGGDLARKHHTEADGVAAGHYLAKCAETYWLAAKKP